MPIPYELTWLNMDGAGTFTAVRLHAGLLPSSTFVRRQDYVSRAAWQKLGERDKKSENHKKITKKWELCRLISRQKGCKSSRLAYNLHIKQVGRRSSASAGLIAPVALADGGRSFVTYLQTC